MHQFITNRASDVVLILLLVVGFTLLGACSTTSLPSSEMTVDGESREDRLFVPTAKPAAPMPLVLAIHGGGGRDFDFPQQEAFEALAEREGFVIAYPLSQQQPSNEGEWQLNANPQSQQDLNFIEALIDEIAVSHNIDQRRVYATGYSLGSMFTYDLACQLSDRFAAVASHAGTMPVSPRACEQASNNVAIMHIHGLEDTIIAYGESWNWKQWDSVGPMQDIPSLVEYWSAAHNCSDHRESPSLDSLHIVHESCDQEVRVEHYRLDNGGHEWPETINGRLTTEVIWGFFEGFSTTN